MDVIKSIRQRQTELAREKHLPPPAHRPQMLYIGCVDARLDPIDDLGIPKGKSLIYRNIAALVNKSEIGHAVETKAALETGEIPQSASVGAVLEFFLNHLPRSEDGIRHIVVSGHTDCGGLKACCAGVRGEHDEHLPLYIHNLKPARDVVKAEAAKHGWDSARELQELEKESVRMSVRNLMEFKAVKRALAEGSVELHGWIIDTGTARISEMDLNTGQFKPMELEPATARTAGGGGSTGFHR